MCDSRNHLDTSYARLALLGGGLLVIAFDTGRQPLLTQWVWTHLYAACFLTLSVWIVTGRPWCRDVFVAVFSTVSTIRAMSLLTEARYAGAALNLIIVVLLADWIRQRRAESAHC